MKENSPKILYGLSVGAFDFFDESEKERIPEDGICENEYGRYYIAQDALIPIEYIGNFAGKKYVIKETMKNEEATYYSVEDFDGDIVVLETNGSEEAAVWNLSEEDDLSRVYKAFRTHGILLTNDLYHKRELEAQRREAVQLRERLEQQREMEKNLQKRPTLFSILTLGLQKKNQNDLPKI